MAVVVINHHLEKIAEFEQFLIFFNRKKQFQACAYLETISVENLAYGLYVVFSIVLLGYTPYCPKYFGNHDFVVVAANTKSS